MQLKDVEGKIRATGLLLRFVSILNLLSTVRFKRFRGRVAEGLAYHRLLERMLTTLYSRYPIEGLHPLFRKVEIPKKVDIYLLLSKKGFVGDFNRRLELFLDRLSEDFPEVHPFAVGEKGASLLKKGKVERLFPSPIDENGYPNEGLFKSLTDFMMERFASGKTDKVLLVYLTPSKVGRNEEPSEGTASRSLPTEERRVPFYEPERRLKETKLSPGGSLRVRVLEFLPPRLERVEKTRIVNIEGNEISLLSRLIRAYLHSVLKFVFLESLAAETVARLNATTQIAKRAEDRLRELKILRSKLRAEILTEQLAEITSVWLAFRKEYRLPSLERERRVLYLGDTGLPFEELTEHFPAEEVKKIPTVGLKYLKLNLLPQKEVSFLIDLSLEGLLEDLKRFLEL